MKALMNQKNRITYLKIIISYLFMITIYIVFKKIISNNSHLTTSVTQVISYCFLYCLELPVFMLYTRKIKIKKLEKKRIKASNLFKLVIVQSGISSLVLLAGNIIYYFFKGQVSTIDSDLNLIDILILMIGAPLMEEVLFRLVLIEKISFMSKKVQIFTSATIFALPHIISQGFPQTCYAFVLGLLWAGIYIHTRTIYYTAMLHSISNIWMGLAIKLCLNLGVSRIVIAILWYGLLPTISLYFLRKVETNILFDKIFK